jgi:hypothetical protein
VASDYYTEHAVIEHLCDKREFYWNNRTRLL